MNEPTGTTYHQRPQWAQVQERGVIDLTEQVEDHLRRDLLPRVVIRGAARIEHVRGHLVIGPLGARNDYLTLTFAPQVLLTTGCFTGSLEAFEREVAMKPAGDCYRDEYEAVIALVRALVAIRKLGEVPRC